MTTIARRSGKKAERDPAHRARVRDGAPILAWIIGLLYVFPVVYIWATGLQDGGGRGRAAAVDHPHAQRRPAGHLRVHVRELRGGAGARLLAVLRAFHHRGHPVHAARHRAGAAVRLRADLAQARRAAARCCSSSCPRSSCPRSASSWRCSTSQSNCSMIDQLPTLIVMYTAMNLPIAVWMLRSFLDEVPKDVLDASKVDGAKTWQELFRDRHPDDRARASSRPSSSSRSSPGTSSSWRSR